MEALLRDLGLGLRSLRRQPGFTVIAILSLMLGIGANTAIFTLVNAVLLRPLPMPSQEQLVFIFGSRESAAGTAKYRRFSYANYLDYREQTETFSGITTYQGLAMSLAGPGGHPERVVGRLVSENYFEVLGVNAAHGRVFRPDTGQASERGPEVVLSHGLWTRRFGARSEIVGDTVTLNRHSFTVVGVAPRDFHGVKRNRDVDVWIPMSMYEQVSPHARYLDQRGVAMFFLIGRLKDEADLRQAEAEMTTLAHRLEQRYPDDNRGLGVHLIPLSSATIHPKDRPLFVRAGSLLSAVVGLVLLIACVTVANLLLAKAENRRRELAIRRALGAGRGRLLRQLLTESTLLFVLGGLLSFPIALWGLNLLWRRFTPPEFAVGAIDLDPDLRVYAFTLGISLLFGLLFGLAPALKASRADPAVQLKDTAGTVSCGRSRRGWELRGVLVVVQIALSLVALLTAGLLVRSLLFAQRIDPGFEREKLLVVSFDLGAASYAEPQAREFYRRAVERVGALPGIESASLARTPLLKDAVLRQPIVLEGQETPAEGGLYVHTNNVSAGYFETVGIPVLRGRGFGSQERQDSPLVAVVNQTMAQRFWPGQEAVGQRFRFDGSGDWREVIGMARDSTYEGLGEAPMPYLYLPLEQAYASAVTLHARVAGNPATLLATVQREVQGLDETLGLYDARAISQLLGSALWGPRTAAVLLSLFAVLALVLATGGLYGVMSFLAGQRQREIGLRMALGARRSDVLALVLKQGALLIALGAGLGVVAAAWVTRTLRGLLYGIGATDPLTFISITLLLVVVALGAIYLPSQRAARQEPVKALRHP